MDKLWLQNLAQAAYVDGEWRPADQRRVEQLVRNRMDHFLADLQRELEDAALVFNQYAQQEREINLLLLSPQGERAGGILVLMGRSQLKIQQVAPDRLEVTLVELSGYERKERIVHGLQAEISTLGDVLWRDKDDRRYNIDLLVKTMLQNLATTAART